MDANYANTYWCSKGKHESLKNELQPLIPAADAVPNADANPALEKFRVASNCYYDLYNNGLCNRAAEFRKVFGFSALKLMTRHRGLGRALTQKVIDRTEKRMDEIILAAHAEQFPRLNKLQELGIAPIADRSPIRCPYCGGIYITELDQWAAVSAEDTENTVTLVEWQCVNACGGRAFWV